MATTSKTSREKNLEQVLNLQNELNALQGVAPETDEYIRKFDKSNASDIIRTIRNLKEKIEEAKKKNAVDDFFKGSGLELKQRIDKRMEELRNQFQRLYDGIDTLAKENFKDTSWTVTGTFVQSYQAGIRICIVDPETEKPIFGTEVTLQYEAPIFLHKEATFRTNVGSCGSNDIFDISQTSRTFFYIQLGELFKNQEKLHRINEAMEKMTEEYRKASKAYDNVEAVLKDPFNNTLTV